MLRIVFAVPVLLIAASASADIRVDYVLDGDACVPDQRVIEVQGTRLRVDFGGTAGNISAIVDGTEALAWSLDHDQHTVAQIEIDADAIDFQGDVGQATAHRVDRELDKLAAAQRDAEKQMAAQCEQLKRKGGDCPMMGAMPDIRAMLSPENMARMQQAMAGAGDAEGGAMQMDRVQLQAMLGAGGGSVDPAMQKQMQSLMSGKQQQKQQRKMLAARARQEGVDVKTLQERDAQARQQAQAGARQRLTEHREMGTGTVAGLDCTRYQLEFNGVVTGSECRAEWAALKLDDRDAKGSALTLRLAQQYGQSFAPIQKALGGAVVTDDGFSSSIVLERICVARARETGRATARISREPIAAERFELPSGYAPAFATQ